MSGLYDARTHNAETLSAQMSGLAESQIIVGSIGRCMVTESLKTLRRSDNSPSDLDVIDLRGLPSTGSNDLSGDFRVDSGMTKILRPVDAEQPHKWGLFLANSAELFIELGEHEVLEPQNRPIPWDPERRTAYTLSPQIQAELIDITGPYSKDPAAAKAFKELVATHFEPLPADLSEQFATYKHFRRTMRHARHNWRVDRQSYSVNESMYRQARTAFKVFTPARVQHAVNSAIGDTIRAIRGTHSEQ